MNIKKVFSILFTMILGVAIAAIIFYGSMFVLAWLICGGMFGGSDGMGGAIFIGVMLIVILFWLIKIIIKWGWGGKKNKDKEGDQKIVFDNKEKEKELKQLLGYINFAKNKGFSDREIENNLKKYGGWKDDEIQSAFNFIKK